MTVSEMREKYWERQAYVVKPNVELRNPNNQQHKQGGALF